MSNDSRIQLSPEDRATLEGWVANRNSPQKWVWRARIVLMWVQGDGVTSIVRATGKTKRTAYRWRDRYISRGIEGLKRDATRPSRKPPLSAEVIKRVVDMTLHQKPRAGTHWSVRKLAKVAGISPSSVQRIWAAHGLKPHRVRTFRACCYLAESGFPNGIGYDSSFLLEWGASMDDATLFRGSSGTSSDAVGCRRYGSGDRGGAIDQPVVLVEMAQAAA